MTDPGDISLAPKWLIEQVCLVLNEALHKDPESIHKIFGVVVEGEKLKDHPTIQIGFRDNRYTLTVLGLINGILGVDAKGWGPISAVWDDGRLIEFKINPNLDTPPAPPQDPPMR